MSASPEAEVGIVRQFRGPKLDHGFGYLSRVRFAPGVSFPRCGGQGWLVADHAA